MYCDARLLRKKPRGRPIHAEKGVSLQRLTDAKKRAAPTIMTTPAAAVKVVVRIRPLNAYEQRDGDTPIVRAYAGDDGRQNRVIVDGQREETFEYATSLSETANECDVAKAANAQQLVQRVVDGRNATVLAYGQTAAGKTHTIDGLLPRSSTASSRLLMTATSRRARCR